MKIAVCVKHVPEGTTHARIDPQTKRLDRSGEGPVRFLRHPRGRGGARIRDAQQGEVLVVSMGPQSAQDSVRKALAMGADSALMITDDAAGGSDLGATATTLAAALRARGGRPHPLRPAVQRLRRRRPLGRGRGQAATAGHLQVAELTVTDGKVTGKRPDGVRLRRSGSPLPAVVAVSDAINEPRYPSLKGIMGARSKPQRSVSLSELGVDAGNVGEAGSKNSRRGTQRPAAAGIRSRSRTTGARRRRSSSTSRRRRSCYEHSGFLEHHEGELLKAGARRALEGGRARRRRRRRRARSRCPRPGVAGGAYGAAKVYVADKPELEQPLPQPRVGALAALVGAQDVDTVLFAASVLSADVASGLAARLGAGLNRTSPTSFRRTDS